MQSKNAAIFNHWVAAPVAAGWIWGAFCRHFWRRKQQVKTSNRSFLCLQRTSVHYCDADRSEAKKLYVHDVMSVKWKTGLEKMEASDLRRTSQGTMLMCWTSQEILGYVPVLSTRNRAQQHNSEIKKKNVSCIRPEKKREKKRKLRKLPSHFVSCSSLCWFSETTRASSKQTGT